MNIFKPEDFENIANSFIPMERKIISDHASRILTEWIEKNGVRVYGQYTRQFPRPLMSTIFEKADTHQAILIGIQEIVKKTCEHEVSSSDITLVSNGSVKYRCRFCDVNLKPTGWEVVEP